MIYNACCLESSQNLDFLLCPICASPLLRCTKGSSCVGLTDAFGHCPVCLNPKLLVDTGYTVKSGQHGIIAAQIHNCGFIGFQLQKVCYRFSDSQPYQEKTIQKEIPAQSREEFYLAGFEPERAGHYVLQLCLYLASGNNLFCFTSEIRLVEVAEKKEQHIHVEHLHASGQAIVDISAADYGMTRSTGHQESWQEMKLVHSPMSQGYGYEDKTYLTRMCEMHYSDPETGKNSLLRFYKKNHLVFGRNRPEKDTSMDAMVRIFPRNDHNDDLTRRISCHHFKLVLRGGKIFFQDCSTYGSIVSGEVLSKGMERIVKNGDTICPFSELQYSRYCWKIHFHYCQNEITRITIQQNF